jgi:hypothetical protein
VFIARSTFCSHAYWFPTGSVLLICYALPCALRRRRKVFSLSESGNSRWIGVARCAVVCRVRVHGCCIQHAKEHAAQEKKKKKQHLNAPARSVMVIGQKTWSCETFSGY